MAEDISCGPEIDVPENNDNSKLQLEADAFLNAIAGGADEDQADEAAFFAANPDGIVVDDNGEVLESGANSKIKKGEKVEFIDDDDVTSEQEKPAVAAAPLAGGTSALLPELQRVDLLSLDRILAFCVPLTLL